MMKTIDPLAAERAPLIVQVVRQYAPSRGGLEDVVANLAQQMLRRGYRVRVVTCDRLFTAPGMALSPHEIVDGVEVVRVPWSGGSRYPLAPKVFAHLRDADLVHVHAVDFFFDALAWGRLLHGRPMIATTHGGFFHTQKYAAIKKIWFQTVTRASASAYQALVSCSRSDLKLFSTIVPSKRLALIENGVDTRKFSDAAARSPERRIVTLGRFSVNKRLDRLLDMMAALVARESSWQLDIAGVESDLSQGDLAREIAARGLQGNVTLHLRLDNAAIRTLIGGASFFASASEYEGFGLVAVEAMSGGLLPVLHPNDAYAALAARHADLVLADFSAAGAAAEAVLAAYNRLRADHSGLRSRLMIEAAGYAWDGVADRYEDIYRAVLRPGSVTPASRPEGKAA
jgi:alpha-1,3-mannosyltransferase